jgi:hypothetical protein
MYNIYIYIICNDNDPAEAKLIQDRNNKTKRSIKFVYKMNAIKS